MAPKKKTSKVREEIEKIYEERELASLKSSQSRAASITVGTTGGGLIEISLRGDYANLWYVLHPVEAIELIEQLAAAAGVEVAKRPKEDFSSWRSWNPDRPDSNLWKGSAPHQLSDRDKKQLSKFDEFKYGILPATTSVEKPKLEATTRRRKKVEE